MPFRGVFSAPELLPAPCGLLSVARVHTPEDEMWTQGIDVMSDSRATVRLLSTFDVVVSGGLLYDATATSERFFPVEPFWIEVEDKASTFGILSEDKFDLVKKQLECVTQKGLETEFWDGLVATSVLADTSYLVNASSAVIPHAGIHDVSQGLMHLEQSLASSPLGQGGVIHITRDIASLLTFNRLIYTENDGKATIKTHLGTPVVVGSGYSGNGPVGETGAAATLTNKWMFATGSVHVVLGDIEVVNETLGQGYNVTSGNNTLTIKAVRPAATYFDKTSMHYAVRVIIPDI